MNTAINTPAAAATFTFSFNFKTIQADALEKILSGAENREAVAAQFDEVKKKGPDGAEVVAGYKRKAIAANLSAPDWLASLDSLAQQVVQLYIADFVKGQYVDQFAEIGAHDWDFIKQEAAKVVARGGSVRLDISDEVWAGMAESFGAYISAKLGNAELGERMANAFLGKFSKSVCQRQLNSSTENLLNKIKGHLEGWVTHTATNSPEVADDAVKVYEFLDGKIDKQLNDMLVDVEAML